MADRKPRAGRTGLGGLARHLTTSARREDLQLEPGTEAQLEAVRRWLRQGTRAGRATAKAAPRGGFRVLADGPPGAGNALAARLLGDAAERAFYRVDLSRVVSRYIGETEKNLDRIFETAERRDWILLFDEADALFGKRGAVKDAHDRYANLEVSYLLDRIENYPGLVVLTTNRRGDLDPSFVRRFDAVMTFSTPRKAARDDD